MSHRYKITVKMQEMQNKVFKLGFGPIPYYRRPGVLVHISPLHKDHNERSKFKLGVIVAHRPGAYCIHQWTICEC